MSVSDASSISETDYFFESYPDEIQTKTEGYCPTAEAIEEFVKKPLSERIQLLSDDGRKATYRIDNCLNATVPADALRAQMGKHWETVVEKWKKEQEATTIREQALIDSYKTWGKSYAVLSIVSAAIAFAFPTEGLFLLAVNVAACAINFYKAHKTSCALEDAVRSTQAEINRASYQLTQWNTSPAETIASKREQAYRLGFYALFNPTTLRAELLPFEIISLFEKYRAARCEELSSQYCVGDEQKAAWLNQFIAVNPVSGVVLRYVYGEVPSEYLAISKEVDALTAGLQATQAQYEKEIEIERSAAAKRAYQIAQDQDQLLRPFKIEQERLLKIAEEMKKNNQRTIADQRDEQLRLHRQTNDQIWTQYNRLLQEINSAYDAQVSLCNVDFAAKTNPIKESFLQQTRANEERLEAAIKTIEQNRLSALRTPYDDARKILNSIKELMANVKVA